MTTAATSPPALPFPGLTDAEVLASRQQHGPNLLTPPPRDPWWKLWLEKFEDPVIRILIIAAVIALVAAVVEGQGHFAEPIGILVAIFLATTLAFVNEFKAAREFDILNKVSDEVPVKVIRNGAVTTVPSRDLVVGDVVLIEIGEEVQADGSVLEAVNLQIDESRLTGESVPASKMDAATRDRLKPQEAAYPADRALRGTMVADGRGILKITAVGDGTEIGKTQRAAQEETGEETPLNKQLEKLSKLIGVVGLACAVFTFAGLVIRGAVTEEKKAITAQGPDGRPVEVMPLAKMNRLSFPKAESLEPAEVLELVPKHQKEAGTADQTEWVRGERPGMALTPRAIPDGNWTVVLAQSPAGQPVGVIPAQVGPELDLTRSQWLFAAILGLGVAIGLIRVWLPMIYDGLEMAGQDVEPPAWLEDESLAAWGKSLALGVAVFAVGTGLTWALSLIPASPADWLAGGAGMTFLRYFMVAVTIIVVAVPEGLAMSVTLSLAYSMRKMTAANNLVRKMHACETIGAATAICSDKTGTLTMNEMRVHEVHFPALQGTKLDKELRGVAGLVAEAVAANSTAHLGRDPGEPVKVVGNPTEGALLLWLDNHGIDYVSRRRQFAIAHQWTFSTERKFMATLGTAAGMGGQILHVKGAPEIVLGRCATQLTPGGKKPLSPEEKAQIERQLKDYQLRGMRTLGFAYHDAPPAGAADADVLQLAQNLTWLGFAAIADPIRQEVPGAIAACRKAGVQVKMVTGDNPATAREIARQIGLWQDGDREDQIILGPDFAALSDEEAKKRVLELKVMSRARPLDKLRLVRLLKENNQVVAVTGDGTNDAPALNYADVGLAMGKTGTAVAKEASDIILLDDSFQSIVNAIMWGRSLYLNIQRFVLFQLTINVAALTIALLGPYLGIDTPLTVMQMLWINLIMDTFAALALATEPPSWAVMEGPPRKPDDFIVSPAMARNMFITGLAFAAALLGLLLYFQRDGHVDDHEESIFFTIFVMLQFWNLFNARCLGTARSAFTNLFENKAFVSIAAAILIGQVFIVTFGGETFRVTPLNPLEWLAILGGTGLVLVVGEAMRAQARAAAKAPA